MDSEHFSAEDRETISNHLSTETELSRDDPLYAKIQAYMIREMKEYDERKAALYDYACTLLEESKRLILIDNKASINFYRDYMNNLKDICGHSYEKLKLEIISYSSYLYKKKQYPYAILVLTDELNILGKYDDSDVRILYNLVMCYSANNNIKKAISVYEQILKTCAMYKGILHYDKFIARSITKLGRLKYEIGQLKESIALFNEALIIIQKYDSIDEFKILKAETLQTLGQILKMFGKLSDSYNIFNQSLALFQTFDPTDKNNKSNIASIYIGIGNIEKVRGRYREAHDLYMKGLEMTIEFHTPIILSSLSHLFYLQDNFEESKRYYYEALEHINRLCEKGKSEDMFVSIFSNLTNIFCVNIDEIVTLCHKSLEIMYRLYDRDTDHHDIAMVMSNLGHALCLKDCLNDSEIIQRDSIEMMKRLYEDTYHSDIVMAMEHYSFLKEKQGIMSDTKHA